MGWGTQRFKYVHRDMRQYTLSMQAGLSVGPWGID